MSTASTVSLLVVVLLLLLLNEHPAAVKVSIDPMASTARTFFIFL